MLDQQFYKNEKFQEFLNSNFVLFRASRGEQRGDEVFKRFDISATPTIMVLDIDGSEYDWHVGYGPPPEKFQERLEKTLQGIDTFKSLSENYKKDPKNVEAVFKLARKYDRKYDQEKAKELYQEVLVLDPEGKKGTTDYQEEKVTYTEYAEYSIGRFSIYTRNMDPEPFKAFIKKYPESKLQKNAYQGISLYYRSRGSKEEAIAFFEDYTSRWPDDPYVLRSYVTRIIRDKDEAQLDKGIELAEKIKNDIMKYNPDPYYIKDLADLHLLKGEEEKAEEVYGKRFMEGQVSTLSFNLRTYADFWARKNKNLESAEEMMELAMKLSPDEWYVLRSAAMLYMKLKKPDKALEVYGPEYIRKYMDKASVLNSYAFFWAGQGKNLESALEAAKKSVELSPSAYTWDTLSQVNMKLKKHDEALKTAEKALELADENVKARFESRIKMIKKAMEKEKEK